MGQLQHVYATGDYFLLPGSELFVERQQEIEESIGKILLGVQVCWSVIHIGRRGAFNLKCRAISIFRTNTATSWQGVNPESNTFTLWSMRAHCGHQTEPARIKATTGAALIAAASSVLGLAPVSQSRVHLVRDSPLLPCESGCGSQRSWLLCGSLAAQALDRLPIGLQESRRCGRSFSKEKFPKACGSNS